MEDMILGIATLLVMSPFLILEIAVLVICSGPIAAWIYSAFGLDTMVAWLSSGMSREIS